MLEAAKPAVAFNESAIAATSSGGVIGASNNTLARHDPLKHIDSISHCITLI